MLDAILQKVVMNGSTVSLIDLPKLKEIQGKVDKLRKIFYQGEELTEFEQDMERMYIGAKLEKHTAYSKRKSMRFKVRWTVSDLNKFQD